RAPARGRSADHRGSLFPRALRGGVGDRAWTAAREGQIAAVASTRAAATATGGNAMSAELEQRLLALGAALDVPPAPDLVPAVLTGLPARRRRVRRPAGRVLAVAFATVLLLAGVAMAVPASRDAILRAIGLRGVSIERVPRLPPIPPTQTGARLRLGRPIPLARVRRAAGFAPLLPPRAADAYIGHDVPGGRVSILIGRVLITEF